MKVLRDGDRLLRIGKALEPGRYNAESIGLLAFRGEGPRLFADQVERMMRQPDGTRRWYLRAIDALAQAGADVRTVSIRGEEWQEVDFPEDVEAAKALTARWARIRKPSVRRKAVPDPVGATPTSASICPGSSVTASPSAGTFGQPASATLTPQASRSPS